MESANGCLAFSKFFTTNLIAPPHTEDIDFSDCSFNPMHLQRIKITFEYSGLALSVLPFTSYLGLLFLMLAVPLEYELLREKATKRVLYFIQTGKTFDHKVLKSWMQMKSLGSKLIVGVPRRDAMDMVMNACASNTVDQVVVEAPTKCDLLFIEKQGIDFVILEPGQNNMVTEEVVNANRVLILGEHGHLRRFKLKGSEHEE